MVIKGASGFSTFSRSYLSLCLMCFYDLKCKSSVLTISLTIVTTNNFNQIFITKKYFVRLA